MKLTFMQFSEKIVLLKFTSTEILKILRENFQKIFDRYLIDVKETGYFENKPSLTLNQHELLVARYTFTLNEHELLVARYTFTLN